MKQECSIPALPIAVELTFAGARISQTASVLDPIASYHLCSLPFVSNLQEYT